MIEVKSITRDAFELQPGHLRRNEHVVEVWVNGRKLTSTPYPTSGHAHDDAMLIGAALLPAMSHAPRPGSDPEQYTRVYNHNAVIERVVNVIKAHDSENPDPDAFAREVIKAVLG